MGGGWWGLWPGWVLRVGLPSAALLALASVVPSEEVWARAAAQVVAVVVPLGLEVVRGRWVRGRDRVDSAVRLRSRLDALSVTVPEGLRRGLDDPGYRIAPYWGRSADHGRLDEARAHSSPGVILVSGAAWSGKTRLLTEWALGLPGDVVAGWLRAGTVVEVVEAAKQLGSPVVLLQQGEDAETVAALVALSGSDSPVTLVIEKRDASHLADAARDASPGAGRLIDNAAGVAVVSPGTASDLEYRYGQMVRAYATVAGTWRTDHQPRSTRRWSVEPIGLVSAFAMMGALKDRSDGIGLSAIESFGEYWADLRKPWLKERPAARFGLPPLSDVQLETAVVIDLLTDGRGSSAFLHSGMFDRLNEHEAAHLELWTREVARSDRTGSSLIAAVAATQAWSDALRDDVGKAVRDGSPRGLVSVIRRCHAAEQMLDQRPALTGAVLASGVEAVRAALDALVGEVVTRPIDLLLAEHVSTAPITFDQADATVALPVVERVPQTRVALLQQRFSKLPPDAPLEQRAEFAADLAIRLSEVGRSKEALAPAEEAVGLYRRLADPETGNPDRFTPDLASSLNNLANRLSEVGRSKEALAPAEEAVGLRRRLADPETGNPEHFNRKLLAARRHLDELTHAITKGQEFPPRPPH